MADKDFSSRRPYGKAMLARRLITIWLGAAACGLAALALVAAIVGVPSSFIDPDESAHYVNTLFLADWLRAGLPTPMAFARDYYAHFPKLSIGHWPPGWYLLLAPPFALLRPSPHAALMLSAIIAGTPAGLILWGSRRAGCARIGMAAAIVYLLLPVVVDGARHFLLDQPVTLIVGIAAMGWARATERPGWPRFAIFASLAAAAALIKGNGALIAFVPAFDILLARRWALLRHPGLWLAAAMTTAIVLPWYWLSFRIAAGGFNYAPGAGYAGLALAANVRTILANLGWSGILLALVGACLAWRERAGNPAAARVAGLAGAVIAATLIFQSAIPAAIEPRYMAPLLPWAVLLAATGAVAIWRHATVIARVSAGILAFAALVPAAGNLATLPPSTDLAAPALAETMTAHPGIWLVDGRAGEEGAVIAAAAHADRGDRRIWIARASQWLSTSDFMGRHYRLTAPTPGTARAMLDRLGVAGVVSIAGRHGPAYPHSAILRAALASPAFTIEDRPFRSGTGSMLLALRRTPAAANPALLEAGSGSADRAKLGAILN